MSPEDYLYNAARAFPPCQPFAVIVANTRHQGVGPPALVFDGTLCSLFR